MIYLLIADIVLVVHLAFVVFVVTGGFLTWRRPWIALIHLPAALWGALVEFTGWLCPLTPLEQWLRQAGGKAGYEGDFLGRYLLPLLYPLELTREVQIGLGVIVVVVNIFAYGWMLRKKFAGFASNTERN